MNRVQMVSWAATLQKPHLTRPILCTDLEALSPYEFYDIEDLRKALSSYKPKYKKGRKTLLDNSQANHAYAMAGLDSGVPRGAFEHGR
jgi:hypothetical protein